MREEEECEPGCYRHIYLLHDRYEKIANGECKRLNPEEDEMFLGPSLVSGTIGNEKQISGSQN